MGRNDAQRRNDAVIKPEDDEFQLYEYVRKKTGYRYPGMVMAKFTNRSGAIRYVVEAIHPDFTGMLHIFNGNQLERDTYDNWSVK
jgi:hypothetical protein